MSQCMWCPLPGVLLLQDGLPTDVSTPVGVSIGVAILDYLCSRIQTGVDRYLGILSLHQH